MLALCSASLNGRAKDVSLELQSGELLVLIGPNGAGKSSVLAMLSGLTTPDEGQALLDSAPLNSLSPAKLATRRAVMEQQPALASGLSVRNIVEMGAYQHANQDAVNQALELSCTDNLSARKIETLSGGETQRVMLARTLAQLLNTPSRERYLLLDEPTAALDIGMADSLMSLIARIAHDLNFGVLTVLHDINLASRYADRVGLMANGKLYAIGATEQVMQSAKLEALYGIKLTELQHAADKSIKSFVPQK